MSSLLTNKIFQFLNKRVNYAVLRNYEGLPHKNAGRDIDLLIEKKVFLVVENELIKLITDEKYKILTRYQSEKMIAYVFAKVIEGNTVILQFDFLFETSFFGIQLLETQKILSSRIFNGNIYHVSDEYQFLDKYLWLKCIGASYPEKYFFLKDKMKENKLLLNLINDLVDCVNLEELEKLSSFQLKSMLFFKNLKTKPIALISNLFLFVFYHVVNSIFYKGFSVGFTGPDGSGKTTVINIISDQFSKIYSSIGIFHFRPHLTPNIGDAAQKAKLISEVDKNYSNPHRGGKTNKISSILRLLYYSLDYIIGYTIKIRRFLQRRSLVVFDRYFTDVIADSRRSGIYLNYKFLYWFGKLFIPSLDYNILLTADIETILKRKQELTPEGIHNINEKLNYLADKKDYYLVLNDGNPGEAVQKIMSIIIENQHQKNMRRIG